MTEIRKFSFYLYNDNQILISTEKEEGIHNFPKGIVDVEEYFSSALDNALCAYEISSIPTYLFLSRTQNTGNLADEVCAVYIGKLTSPIKNVIQEDHELRWINTSDLLKSIYKKEKKYDSEFRKEFKRLIRNRKLIKKL